MPARASDPPDGISTVVSARRVLIDGTVSGVPFGTLRVIEFSVDRSETSVITRRLMRPSDSTTGVKTKLTPNFLKLICGWQIGGDLVVSHDRPLGIGNSPPATKLAVSPEIAVRLGSAKVRTTPARSMALSVALMFLNEAPNELSESAAPVAENGLDWLKFTTAVP